MAAIVSAGRNEIVQTESVQLQVRLRAFVRRETRTRWIAVCPALGVASQGRDEDDARRSLHEAVELWFESCIERGTLDEALREAGFRPAPWGEAEHAENAVRLRRAGADEDIRGHEVPLDVSIPAYQAALLLPSQA